MKTVLKFSQSKHDQTGSIFHEEYMAVLGKGRRKLRYKEMEFLWWVGADGDQCNEIYLNIVSEDKRVILSYRVGIGFGGISKGRMFEGHSTSGKWEVYDIPDKEPLRIVTPGDVRKIVRWAVDGRGAVPAEVALNGCAAGHLIRGEQE